MNIPDTNDSPGSAEMNASVSDMFIMQLKSRSFSSHDDIRIVSDNHHSSGNLAEFFRGCANVKVSRRKKRISRWQPAISKDSADGLPGRPIRQDSSSNLSVEENNDRLPKQPLRQDSRRNIICLPAIPQRRCSDKDVSVCRPPMRPTKSLQKLSRAVDSRHHYAIAA